MNIDVGYASRGLDDWTYAFADQGVGEVSDFDLAVTTDFTNVDFPAGSMSPTTKQADRRAAGVSAGSSTSW